MPWTIWAYAPLRQQCFFELTDPYSVKLVIMVSGFLNRAETGQGPCTSLGTVVYRELTGRDVRVVMIAGMRTSVCRYGKNCTLTLSWYRCSWVRCQKHVTVGAKRLRCAEVLLGTFFCFCLISTLARTWMLRSILRFPRVLHSPRVLLVEMCASECRYGKGYASALRLVWCSCLITVGAKCRPLRGNISQSFTFDAKCFHCTEVFLLSAPNASIARKYCHS